MSNIDLTKILNVGDEVYSTSHGTITVVRIRGKDAEFPIVCESKLLRFYDLTFTSDGRLYTKSDCEPVLYPSKEMRDWNEFIKNKWSSIPEGSKVMFLTPLSACWRLGFYTGGTSCEFNNTIFNGCTSIIPLPKFDFENIDNNLK